MNDEPDSPSPSSDDEGRKLARMVARLAQDESRHGEMFRRLLAAELHLFIPPHPEMEGLHALGNGDSFTWTTVRDAKGDFVPVFVCLEEAERRAAQLPPPHPMIATIQGEVLFKILNGGRATVRIMAGDGHILLRPEAVGSLARGEFTNPCPRSQEDEDGEPEPSTGFKEQTIRAQVTTGCAVPILPSPLAPT